MLGTAPFTIRTSLLLSIVSLVFTTSAHTEGLQTFKDAVYVDADFNDGDSFKLHFNGKDHVARLYFVDSPETTAASKTDRARLREQANHFGITEAPAMLEFGHNATDLSRSLLKDKNFLVHTAFANAMGRSKLPRIYVMITLGDGTDLAAHLVSHGLARSVGVRRSLPDGTPSEEYRTQLDDLELAAALSRRGAWSGTDAEKIAEMRATSRAEQLELDREFSAFFNLSEDDPLDLNACSLEDLQLFKGIGETLASRIIAARPFTSIEQLKDVTGIGPVLYKQMAPFVTISE